MLTASVLPEVADQRVTWRVNDETIATIDETTRILTPLLLSKVQVTATSAVNGLQSEPFTVMVKGDPYLALVSTPEYAWQLGVEGRTPVVYGAEGQNLEVYNVSGIRLHRADLVNDSPYRVVVPQGGIYIIRVGNSSRKVVVQ